MSHDGRQEDSGSRDDPRFEPDDRPEPGGTGGAGAAGGPGAPEKEERDDARDGADEAERSASGPGGRGWSGAFSEMQDLVGDVVGEVMEGVREAAGRRFPRVDMTRGTEGDYLVRADLPGVARDDVRVTTLGGELTIEGERPRPELAEGTEVLRTERGYGGFRRTLRLPPDIDEEAVSAVLEDGVLEIRLPRKSPSEARTVEID